MTQEYTINDDNITIENMQLVDTYINNEDNVENALS